LGDVEIVLGEKFVVNGHEAGLADSGASLEFGEVFLSGPFFVSQCAHARADGAGGDKDHFAASGALGGDLMGELLHLGEVGLFAGVGEDAGAELDDNAGGFREQLVAHGNLVAFFSGNGERIYRTQMGREFFTTRKTKMVRNTRNVRKI
jgi:hypothetical protein